MEDSRDANGGLDLSWHEALVDLLERAKLCQPEELAEEINAATEKLGMDITLYLVDLEQRRLWPLPERGKTTPPPLSVDGTLAGHAFAAVRTHPMSGPAGSYRLWIPMVDGAERLGVAEVTVPDQRTAAALRRRCEVLVGLVSHLVTVKMPYGDVLHRVRRTRPMSAAGELLLAMLPPLTFSCHRLAVSAVLEPCYDVGGDGFDYAVEAGSAWVMVLDGMGKGLTAGLTCATALAAIRAARRDGHGLYAAARAADQALIRQFPDLRLVTGILAQLDMDAGALRYINAGHPAPLLLRAGKAVRSLAGGRRMPLGMDDSTIEVGEETLEPGDRLLLYTDGVVDADDRGGERFGVERLIDLTERCAAARLPGPETLRRLSHAVMDHQSGPPTDDATLLLVEWSHEASERTQP